MEPAALTLSLFVTFALLAGCDEVAMPEAPTSDSATEAATDTDTGDTAVDDQGTLPAPLPACTAGYVPCGASCAKVVDTVQPPLANYRVGGYGFGDPTNYGTHIGEDGSATAGTAVGMIANGCAVLRKTDSQGYEQVLMVEHARADGSRFCSWYGHLSDRAGYQMVGLGPVTRGQTGGYVGWDDENGIGGPHLHLGTREGACILTSYPGFGSVTSVARPSSYHGRMDFQATSLGWSKGKHGWTTLNATSVDTASTLYWTLDPAASDPGVVSEAGLKLDTAYFNGVKASIKSCAPDGETQLFWETTSAAGFAEARSKKVTLLNDCVFHEVTWDLRATTAWTGATRITRLRIDPSRAGAANATTNDRIQIDWVRAVRM